MGIYVDKNIVAAKPAGKCWIQFGYAIGVAEPVSVVVDTFGTGKVSEQKLTELVRKYFDLTPRGIAKELKLTTPIYEKTASYGHFGRMEFEWERTDKAAELAAAASENKSKSKVAV